MNTMLKENLYEVEFDDLNRKEVESFENNNSILGAKVDVSVTLGKCKKSIKDILEIKEGDVICLDKTIDEDLDIYVNDKCVATGESIKNLDKLTAGNLLIYYPQIPWREVMGMRDIIVHHYFEVDADVIFNTVKENIPLLMDTLLQMREDLKE